MNALIPETEMKSRLKFGNLVTLFKQKIEDCVMNEKSIIISASSPIMECRNTILIEDYEFDIAKFYLNNGNFELYLKMNEINDIKYDNTYDECFTFIHNDNTKINLCFL